MNYILRGINNLQKEVRTIKNKINKPLTTILLAALMFFSPFIESFAVLPKSASPSRAYCKGRPPCSPSSEEDSVSPVTLTPSPQTVSPPPPSPSPQPPHSFSELFCIVLYHHEGVNAHTIFISKGEKYTPGIPLNIEDLYDYVQQNPKSILEFFLSMRRYRNPFDVLDIIYVDPEIKVEYGNDLNKVRWKKFDGNPKITAYIRNDYLRTNSCRDPLFFDKIFFVNTSLKTIFFHNTYNNANTLIITPEKDIYGTEKTKLSFQQLEKYVLSNNRGIIEKLQVTPSDHPFSYFDIILISSQITICDSQTLENSGWSRFQPIEKMNYHVYLSKKYINSRPPQPIHNFIFYGAMY